jgi:hypothetical protein
MISKLETFRESDTSKVRNVMQIDTTASWALRDIPCDKIASGAIRNRVVATAIATLPMISAITMLFWYDT